MEENTVILKHNRMQRANNEKVHSRSVGNLVTWPTTSYAIT
jgi:hypothetical protein